MKKTKLLIGTLVLSMGLMGTGYAYWTKQLTVDTTVTSANFDVYFTGASAEQIVEDDVDNTYNTATAVIKDSKTNQVGIEGDQVAYTWDNIYPGSKVAISYKITSASTIPVKAQPIYTLFTEGGDNLAEALDFTVDNTTYEGFAAFKAAMEAKELDLVAASLATPIDQEYTVIVSLDKTVTDLETINRSLTFNINMIWGQFNDAAPEATVEPSPTFVPDFQ